jgi:hemerythrin-like domain-containing protein
LGCLNTRQTGEIDISYLPILPFGDVVDTLPTDDLMSEHRVIERMLRILTNASDRLEKGESVPPELYVGAVDFLRNFADKCHHSKEERLLFVKMMERGVSGEVGPIAVMMREHQDGRAHIKNLDKFSKEKVSKSAKEGLIKSSRAYVDLLSRHIQKEDEVLYPLANQILDKEDQKELEKGFERVEEEVMGPGVHERYHKMIEQWEQKYG